MQNQATEHREIVITAPRLLDELLAEAEAALRQTATARPVAGILVTRHDPHR